jgi:hypothetical protein
MVVVYLHNMQVLYEEPPGELNSSKFPLHLDIFSSFFFPPSGRQSADPAPSYLGNNFLKIGNY